MADLYDRLMVQMQAREIPIPISVSEEAQAVLAMGPLGPPSRELPALDDLEGWKAYVAETDDFVRSMVGDAAAGFAGTIEERETGPCPVYVVTSGTVADTDRRVFFDIHGGAWVLGGGDLCKRTTIALATAVRARAWSVDYRMPPDHPFPTPLTTASGLTGCCWTSAIQARSSSVGRRPGATWRQR